MLRFIFLIFIISCSTIPTVKHKNYSFPEKFVFKEIPKKKYKVIGTVKSRVDFSTLKVERGMDYLCRNYYNKGAKDLLKYAKGKGGDGVIKVRSVTLLLNGEIEVHKTPECSDDGTIGQVLLKGLAIKWDD